MATQVNKDTTPEEIEKIADEYAAILQARKLPADRNKLIADLQSRAASLQQPAMSVDDWKAMWGAQASTPPPPKVKAEVKTKKRSREEGIKAVKEAVRVDGDYFWMSDENIAIGQTWADLRMTGIVQNMLVVGPTGCGKTEGLKQLALKIGKPFYKVDCASVTRPDQWVGHKEVVATDKGPETVYSTSQLLRWLSADGYDPGLLVFDELNRVNPFTMNTLVPLLDGSKSIWVPELGINIEVHPETMIAATANLGAQYTGTYGLDAALYDRFGTIMEQTFPPADEEVKILMKRSGIDEASAHELVAVANNTRARVRNGDLSKPISTRALLDCSYWVSAGMTVMEAAEATFVKKYSDDGGGESERAYIRLTLQGKAGK